MDMITMDNNGYDNYGFALEYNQVLHHCVSYNLYLYLYYNHFVKCICYCTMFYIPSKAVSRAASEGQQLFVKNIHQYLMYCNICNVYQLKSIFYPAFCAFLSISCIEYAISKY